MIVLLLAVALCTSIVVLAELKEFFDRMYRDAKTKDVKKWINLNHISILTVWLASSKEQKRFV